MYDSHVGKWPRGGGGVKKRCHFPPEGDTIGNAITRKCKLGMLTYITMDISVCPPEWHQSAKFRVLAHALKVAGNFTTPKLTIEKGCEIQQNVGLCFWNFTESIFIKNSD